MTGWMFLDDEAKVRHVLKDDFERLTAQPVILDDLCMLMLEKYEDVKQEIKDIVASGSAETMGADLYMRRDQIGEELTLMSALILRYPEVSRSYEAKSHIQLDWKLLSWLVIMPMNNQTPLRNIAVRNYMNNLIKNIDALTIVKDVGLK
jgi:hypothetical protein